MTEEEFVAWCNEDTRAEFVDGEVIVLSPESRIDEALQWLIGGVLSIYVEQRGLGEVYGPNMQTRLRVGRRRSPDLIFVRTDRLHLFAEKHFEGAPDLAVEIVSADSGARDWHDKYLEYEASGVREYWVIDPAIQRVDAYALNDAGRYELLPLTDGAYRSIVVPGFFLRPEWLWQDPLPNKLELLRELGVLPSNPA
jgi:Uma2 family endonuclease